MPDDASVTWRNVPNAPELEMIKAERITARQVGGQRLAQADLEDGNVRSATIYGPPGWNWTSVDYRALAAWALEIAARMEDADA